MIVWKVPLAVLSLLLLFHCYIYPTAGFRFFKAISEPHSLRLFKGQRHQLDCQAVTANGLADIDIIPVDIKDDDQFSSDNIAAGEGALIEVAPRIAWPAGWSLHS